MLLLLLAIVLGSCKTSSVYDDTGSLVFVSHKNYVGKAVYVSIDNHPPFIAKVISKSEWNKYYARTAVHTSTERNTQYNVDYRWKPNDSDWPETKKKPNLVPSYGVVAGMRQVAVAFEGKTVLRKRVKVRGQDKTVVNLP